MSDPYKHLESTFAESGIRFGSWHESQEQAVRFGDSLLTAIRSHRRAA
jgi:hypothetical protein